MPEYRCLCRSMLNMTNRFSKRFQELAEQMQKVEGTLKREQWAHESAPRERVDPQSLLNWVVKVKNLLSNACGVESQHFVYFAEAETVGMYSTNADSLKKMKAVFLAAQEDFDGGYVTTMRSVTQAEVFSSEIEQATELLEKGYKVAAAVIAGTVLETTLRELCDRNQLPHGKLDKMNADLTKAGIYNSLMQKRITALAAIRNSAAHGKPEEFTEADVKMMTTDVERFLADYLN
jgi:hypothetical protein